jgi:hypothetical protein
VSRLKEARQQLRQANRKLTKQKQVIAALRASPANRDAGGGVEGIKPENVVWIFGSGRTGSTWLSLMMTALPDRTRWNEPNVGDLFGKRYQSYKRASGWSSRANREDTGNFILADSFRDTWLRSIRSLVLEGATARFPEVVEKGGYLVIKEPHGSIGAPLLMEALPESRMVFLVRDPRDVVASALHTSVARPNPERKKMAAERPEELVRERAETYLQDITLTKRAYAAHEGRKVLVRYEDLKADTLGTMKRIYSALEIPVDDGELKRVVEKHAWENIPEEKKGEGTVRRRGTSGGWREDLTPRQIEIVERIDAPLLEEFYG